jgi:Chaperone of endosialidase
MKNRKITFTTILLALSFLALPPIVQGVSPAPDGGYPNFNTAEGQKALFGLTTGIWNTALGGFTLSNNTDGSYNTAVGTASLLLNQGNQTTGEGLRNTAVGAASLLSNITGSSNTAVGVVALENNTANSNTAVGDSALKSNTTGNANTATGVNALYLNTTGIYNTAFGTGALFSNNGSDNTAVGSVALGANNDGIQNTALGYVALANNVSGNFNTAIGSEAMNADITGGANTAVGVSALQRNSSGGANTALGYGAGVNVTTGSFNVYIGTDVGGVADDLGHTYISNINSTVQPPGGNVEYVTINLDTKLLGHSSSSRRYKDDIKPIADESKALYRLKPVMYRYKKEIDPKQSAAFGLIAEEVADVNPALVARNSKGQPESVHYDQVNAMLLNEFLKEHKNVARLEATVAQQQKGMEALSVQLKEQAAQIQKVSAHIQMNNSVTKVVLNNQ